MTETTRSEHDSMGEVPVPATALYGAQTARAVANFAISGQGIPPLVVHALGMLKAAAAAAHGVAGRLPPDLAAAIEQAAGEVADGRHDGEFVVDVFQTGSGTSSHMNANEVIANRASELLGGVRGSGRVHPNDHANLGQSSNDVFASAVQIGLLLAIERQLLPELAALAAALHDLADQHWHDLRNGRTHLMDAMPIRFGQQFRGYAQQVDNAGARLRYAADELRALPLGGTAVGTGVNAEPGFAAEVCQGLGERFGVTVHESAQHFQAQSCLDAVVQCSGALRTFASAFYKLVNDVRWQASSALGELRLRALQPGSSIMPAKVNPVVCEAVLMACAQVFGNDAVVGFANSQGQFELQTMQPLLARNAIESALLLANSARAFRDKCLADLEVTGVGAEKVAKNPMLATALTPAIGYEAAAKIAKRAAREGLTIAQVAGAEGLPAAQLELLDPEQLCGEHGRER